MNQPKVRPRCSVSLLCKAQLAQPSSSWLPPPAARGAGSTALAHRVHGPTAITMLTLTPKSITPTEKAQSPYGWAEGTWGASRGAKRGTDLKGLFPAEQRHGATQAQLAWIAAHIGSAREKWATGKHRNKRNIDPFAWWQTVISPAQLACALSAWSHFVRCFQGRINPDLWRSASCTRNAPEVQKNKPLETVCSPGQPSQPGVLLIFFFFLVTIFSPSLFKNNFNSLSPLQGREPVLQFVISNIAVSSDKYQGWISRWFLPPSPEFQFLLSAFRHNCTSHPVPLSPFPFEPTASPKELGLGWTPLLEKQPSTDLYDSV